MGGHVHGDGCCQIRVQASVRASVRQLWECFVLPQHLHAWWMDGVTLEPRPYGRFEERWTAGGVPVITHGVVNEVAPERRIAMSWADESWDFETQVEILFAGADKGSEITIVHSGWHDAPEAQREDLISSHRVAWEYHLDSLSHYAAGLAASGRVRA